MHSWAHTTNTYEAAACVSIGIGARPVTTQDHQRARPQSTVWTLAERSTCGAHATSTVRRGTAAGTLEQQTPLHPYLISLRTFHNRERVLEAQKGVSMCSTMHAPGLWGLQRGPLPLRPAQDFLQETADLDAAVALITCGFLLLRIARGSGGLHTYYLARFQPAPEPGAAAPDAHALLAAHRAGNAAVLAHQPVFTQALHALHCLRELRRRQFATTFITISHRTPWGKGAAINEDADGAVFSHVQRRLGVRL